jgi:hypothetical protein
MLRGEDLVGGSSGVVVGRFEGYGAASPFQADWGRDGREAGSCARERDGQVAATTAVGNLQAHGARAVFAKGFHRGSIPSEEVITKQEKITPFHY